jgi:DNA-binding NtrC family response regulator
MLWVAMSNFDAIKTINQAYASGATTFLTKPLDAEDIRHLIKSFDEYWHIYGEREEPRGVRQSSAQDSLRP